MVWGEHDGALRTAILALKHGGRDDLAGPLAARLTAAVDSATRAASVDLVTWVPSHPLHRFRRPYTASRLLALGVARRLQAPHRKLLSRRGLTRQTSRTRAHRLQLPRRTFRAGPAAEGRSILLIDDVITTGTTFRRAAEALLAAGANAVICAALARTPDPRRCI